MEQTEDLNVSDTVPLVSPSILRQELPMTEAANRTVVETRYAIKRILRQEDPRLLVIVGPCSIHDIDAALEYARARSIRALRSHCQFGGPTCARPLPGRRW